MIQVILWIQDLQYANVLCYQEDEKYGHKALAYCPISA